MSNMVAIAASIAKDAAKEEVELVPQLQRAMKAVRDFGLITNEGDMLNGAVAGVMLLYPEDDPSRERIVTEMLNLINPDALQLPEDFKPVGILKLWNESKEKR